MRNAGKRYAEISEILGVHRVTVNNWYNSYKKRGSIEIKPRGRSKGSGSRLTEEQQTDIQRILIDKNPEQLKFKFALWTRAAVKEMIKKLYGIKMPIRTVGDYLQRWGFTPKKPIKRAYEQAPEKIKKWLDEEYPKIAKRAKKENAEIHWGDETGIQNTANVARGYSPIGTKPEVRINVRREKLSMISAITNNGKVRFMLYEKSMNPKLLIEFMKRLVKSTDKKVFLILDNLRTHHSKKVKSWLEEHKKEIAVFFLPPYSPELNPDEYLNNHLKNSVHSGKLARSKKELKIKTRSCMRTLSKNPHVVINFFKHKKIKYAA